MYILLSYFYLCLQQENTAQLLAQLVLAEQTASGICRNWGQNYDEVLEGLGSELDPTDDLNATSDMRIHLAKVLTRRLLEEW